MVKMNTWIELLVSYLKTFKSFHPVHPTKQVKVQITEGFYALIQHYTQGAYYCVIKCDDDDRPVFAKIVCPFYRKEGNKYVC
jgi:hypothetical protein